MRTPQSTLTRSHRTVGSSRTNGAVTDLETLDRELGELGVAHLVTGQTDSERLFALITAAVRSRGGNVDAALRHALTWVAENLPVYALNLVLATPEQLWALRYPDTHHLYLLERDRGGHRGHASLHAHSRRIHAESDELREQRSIVIATERMDDDRNWRLLDPGELVRIGPDLETQRSYPVPDSPSRRLSLADLDPKAAASQHPAED